MGSWDLPPDTRAPVDRTLFPCRTERLARVQSEGRCSALQSQLEALRRDRDSLAAQADRLQQQLAAAAAALQEAQQQHARQQQQRPGELDLLQRQLLVLEGQLEAERSARLEERAAGAAERDRLEVESRGLKAERAELQKAGAAGTLSGWTVRCALPCPALTACRSLAQMLRAAQRHVASLPPLEQWRELEGALKQATHDYQQLAKRAADARQLLQAKEREAAWLQSEVDRLEGRTAELVQVRMRCRPPPA